MKRKVNRKEQKKFRKHNIKLIFRKKLKFMKELAKKKTK